MSGDDRGSNDSGAESSSGEPADGRLTPVGLKKVSRSVQSLIRQGVIVPNGGDYAPKDVQAEDDCEPAE